jgi:membrane-bound lytic murein transglycosylase A
VRATNRSYAFFRITGLSNEDEPVGAQGVPLTPGRSVAVDRLHEYGTPFFIEAHLPIENAKSVSPFGRLMIAQDTGSAVVGPARADLYWGAGDEAGRIAGRIRHPGRFAMLLPRELDMIAAGRHMPLPVPKPKIADLEVKKQDGKDSAKPASEIGPRKGTPAAKPKVAGPEVKKQDGKGSAKPASEIEPRKGTPVAKPKIAAPEVKKQDGKGSAKSAAEIEPRKGTPVTKPKIAGSGVRKPDGKDRANSANGGESAASKPAVRDATYKPRNVQRN